MTDVAEVQETTSEEKPKIYPVKIDLTPNEDDGEVLAYYKQTMSQVEAIDEKLDAGLDSTGKRKLTNELVEKYQGDDENDGWKQVTDTLIPQMEEMSEEEMVGSFYGLIRTLSDKFKEAADNWLQKQIDSQPKVEDTLSETERKELSEARSELAESAKMIVKMATTFGLCSETEPWALPKRRGAVGKRGKRALTLYSWSIDGEELANDVNSVKGVSQELGFEKSADFTKALRDAKIDTKEPPNEFTVTLNGKSLTGVRKAEDVTEPETSDDDEDSEDEDDE